MCFSKLVTLFPSKVTSNRPSNKLQVIENKSFRARYMRVLNLSLHFTGSLVNLKVTMMKFNDKTFMGGVKLRLGGLSPPPQLFLNFQ